MLATITYAEIATLLNKQLKMGFSLSYLGMDKIRVTFTPHKILGPISIELKFQLTSYSVLNVWISSYSHGVQSIISGLTTLLASKPKPFPFLHITEQGIRIELKRIPQLANVLNKISLTSLVANPNGINLNINI